MTATATAAIHPLTVLPGWRRAWNVPKLRRVIGALIAGLCTVMLAPAAGHCAEGPVPIAMKPGEVRSGSLLLRHGESYADAPRLGIDVDLTVSGPTIRARITQVFRNPGPDWAEAVYAFPLPEGAAVDTLKLIVGDRVILGDIKERKAARRIYDDAKRNGRTAALTEQQRPNLFTNEVANIAPGETVLVQIEYQEPVRQAADGFSLRVPLIIGPRYNPQPLVQSAALRPGGGWGDTVTDPVPDRDRISPPVLDPADHALINPTKISVKLRAGFPLAEVKSTHHAVTVTAPDETTRIITLADGTVPADRDFELTWTQAAGKMPSVGLFREHVGDADYLLATVMPPALGDATVTRIPREVIFVIDNSGSMGGTSIIQAKASLLYALGRLRDGDRFNIIRFDNTMDMLFADPVAADAAHLDRARAFVEALQANGGTEMVPAMHTALSDRRSDDVAMLRQVVFLTDGAIGNEQQLFDTIAALRGRSRIFMIGIGSAPNTYLMTRAAELGRGAFTLIGSVDQVEERMRSLFAKLENPMVTGLAAKFSESGADLTPATLPDVYRGEPLVMAARLGRLAGSVTINGRIGDRPWSVTLPLDRAAEGKGLSKVWARRKIADAEVARTLRQMTPEDADKAILALALQHQLVTRLTSLVAVDATPRRPDGVPLKVSELPINLPAGWDYAKLFGERPSQLSPPRERRAEADLAPAQAQAMVTLPKTATNADLAMIAGAVLTLLGLLTFACRRRFAA